MPGNTAGAVLALTDWLSGNLPAAERTKLKGAADVLAGFALGCALGAAGTLLLGFWCVLLPVLPLAWLARVS